MAKIGSILYSHTLRNMGGNIDGYIGFSDSSDTDYVNPSTTVADNFTVARTTTGIFTLSFVKKFTRILSVTATPVLPVAEATKVDVVSFDNNTIVLRWADTATNGAAKNPSATQGLTFTVYFQESGVNPVVGGS